MVYRLLAVILVGATTVLSAPGAHAKDNPPPKKIIITTPAVITVHRNVAAPVTPGSGGQGSGTIHCDAQNRCSVQLN